MGAGNLVDGVEGQGIDIARIETQDNGPQEDKTEIVNLHGVFIGRGWVLKPELI
jgi:hypothetical protein